MEPDLSAGGAPGVGGGVRGRAIWLGGGGCAELHRALDGAETRGDSERATQIFVVGSVVGPIKVALFISF
jgi:hypothetical protein